MPLDLKNTIFLLFGSCFVEKRCLVRSEELAGQASAVVLKLVSTEDIVCFVLSMSGGINIDYIYFNTCSLL